ncbi:MAG: methionine gamma-lyase family protein, partial [Lachnospiraceae bacterium]|nr:methionine gamma-lyase family protein [Lachnospiraceae bacterium]
MTTEAQYKALGISERVLAFAKPVLASLEGRFQKIDENAELCQLRVIQAMQEARVNEACLKGTTGYGYDDIGREALERTYASYFHTEDALVRPQITCGTHALALALMSNLRPGQVLLSAAGKPYDTLEEVIGIRPCTGSLAEYGITYSQVDLLPDGSFDFEGIRAAIK